MEQRPGTQTQDRNPAADQRRTGSTTLTVSHHGTDYVVPIFVPEGAGPQPLLVLDLHGSHGNAESQADCSRLEGYAERHGFVIARPEGVIDADTPNLERLWLWNVPGVPTTMGFYPADDARDDVAFLTDVIDAAAEQLGTAERAAVAGMSGGARMASAYASRRPDRVAALVAVAGLRAGGDRTQTDVDRPIPVIAIHGDADDVNPYDGSEEPRWSQSVPAALDYWARRNGIPTPAAESDYAERVTRITYQGRDPRGEVTLYRIAGGTHSWPGSDDETAFPDLDASALIAGFVAAHATD